MADKTPADVTKAMGSVTKYITDRKNEFAVQMKKAEGDEAIDAGRKANSAKNDLANLGRIAKRLDEGFYQ